MSNEHLVGVHPNDNTATVWLKVEDLIDIIKEQLKAVLFYAN